MKPRPGSVYLHSRGGLEFEVERAGSCLWSFGEGDAFKDGKLERVLLRSKAKDIPWQLSGFVDEVHVGGSVWQDGWPSGRGEDQTWVH